MGLKSSVSLSFKIFDPNSDHGPLSNDTFRINSVSVKDGKVFFSERGWRGFML